MGELDGRVALITGAGRGIGREHALLFAREGAKVVVNDLGGSNDGTGSDAGPAQEVVDEIRAMGGEAIANDGSVTSWDDALSMVTQAVQTFGGLDIVVNNAGILRDAFLAGMTKEQWDAVVAVHMTGHFHVLRHAAEYWKAEHKAGRTRNAAVINTASGSGTTMPNAGQVNYGAAKAGIAAMTLVAAEELSRYGVRVNGIAPIARTRLTLATPGMAAFFAEPEDPAEADLFSPKQISPLVAYLATEKCQITGRMYSVQGGAIALMRGWEDTAAIDTDDDWTIGDIADRIPQ